MRDDAHIFCVWCGKSWPAGTDIQREKARRSAMYHDSRCEEHPLMQQIKKLREINEALSSQLIGRKRVIEQYVRRPGKEIPPEEMSPLEMLGDTARNSVHDTDIVATIRRKEPSSCIVCGSKEWLLSYRIPTRHFEYVVLLCDTCRRCLDKGEAHKIVAKIGQMADNNQLDSCFMWEDEGKIKSLFDDLKVMVVR